MSYKNKSKSYNAVKKMERDNHSEINVRKYDFVNIAIKVRRISKCYQIYASPQDRLKQSIYPRINKIIRRPKKQYFDEFWALKNVSFTVRKGETVGIVGRNGSGKSTILQIICGTLNATSGSVTTRGRIAALLELGSGFNPEFTGRENVYMNGTIIGLSKEEIDMRFDEICAFADIGAFIDQPVKTYSSGMMVRLAFAVAINVEPQILVVDEALSVGDELFQRKCFSRLEDIKKNGATILFVSHSGGTIVELCDRALLLDSGEKLSIGSPKRVVGNYQKLIYAPQEKQAEIRNEIELYDNSMVNNQVDCESTFSSNNLVLKENVDEKDKDLVEFFDPNLKSQSSMEYESQGAYIISPRILSLCGEKVNCLRKGDQYRYAYTVRFEKAATNVRFGMLIKTTSGIELGGFISAPSICQSIPYIVSGSNVNVEFKFTCNLNPGSYFLNAGVQGSSVGKDTYLHRILDIFMFKVLPIPNNNATAIVDFCCTAEIKINNK